MGLVEKFADGRDSWAWQIMKRTRAREQSVHAHSMDRKEQATSHSKNTTSTQQNIHGSVTGCGRQLPVTDPYTLRYRPGKVHVAYRLYIRICTALIQYRYGTDLLYGSVTDVLSYILYTICIYMFIGASLSEPHTSVTALRDACTCMYVRYDHIPNI